MSPPDFLRRNARRPGHRVGHDALERALPQIAGQQPDQELSLALRGAAEELGQQPPPFRLGTGPGDGTDRLERDVDVGQGEGRRCGPGLRHARIIPNAGADPEQSSERRVSDADLPLQYLSGKEGHRDLHLARRHMTQQRRDLLDLGAAGRGPGHSGRRVNEVGQQHTEIVPQRTRRRCEAGPAAALRPPGRCPPRS